MQDMRELQDKGMMSKEFVDEMQAAIDANPGREFEAARDRIKSLQPSDFRPLIGDSASGFKPALTKNQKKRQRKAKKKSRREHRV